MILKYELLIVIILQIIIIMFVSKGNDKKKRVWNFSWLLAIASNALHSCMLFELLYNDLDSDDRNLFEKMLVGFR